MTAPRRSLLITVAAGLVIASYYLFLVWQSFDPLSGRTPQGRILGLLGWILSLVTSGSYFWQRRRAYTKEAQDAWHAVLGGIALWFLIAHSSFRQGNTVAALAFFALLGGVVSGLIAAFYDRKLSHLTSQAVTSDVVPTTRFRYHQLRQRWVLLHVASATGLLTFAVIHILSILYY